MADGNKEVQTNGKERNVFSAFGQETIVGQSSVVDNAAGSEEAVFKKPSLPANSKTHPASIGAKESVSSKSSERPSTTSQNTSSIDSRNDNTVSMNAEMDNHVVITLKFKDRIFSCATCHISTTSSNGFDEHVAKHILAKPYICLDCKVMFESKTDMDGHAASIHKDEQLKCGLRGMKKIRQITSKLKQLGHYTFKGTVMKKPVSKDSAGKTATAVTTVVSTPSVSQGAPSANSLTEDSISASLESQRQDLVSNSAKESCSVTANSPNTDSGEKETNLSDRKAALQNHLSSSFVTTLPKNNELNKVVKSNILAVESVCLQSSQTEVHQPSMQRDVQHSSAQSGVQLPLTQSEAQQSSAERKEQQPSMPTEVQQPSSQNEVQQPSSESEVQQPSSQNEVQQPSSESEMQQPSLQNEVLQPSSQSEVQLPSLQNEVLQPSSQREVQIPSSESEVQRPYSQSEVQQPSLQSKMQLLSSQSEVLQPSSQSEVQRPSPQSEVQLPSLQNEVLQPSSQSEVKQLSLQNELQRPFPQSEVQQPSLQSKVQLLSSESEVQHLYSQSEVPLSSLQSEGQHPSSQSEVQLPSSESEVQRPSSQSEVQQPSSQSEVPLSSLQNEVQESNVSKSLVPSSVIDGERSTCAVHKTAAEVHSDTDHTNVDREKHLTEASANGSEAKKSEKLIISPDISLKLKQTLRDVLSAKTAADGSEAKLEGKFIFSPDITLKLKQTLREALYVKAQQQKELSSNSSNLPAGASVEGAETSTGNMVVERSEKSTGNMVENSARTDRSEGVSKDHSNTATNIDGLQVTNSSDNSEIDDLNSVNSTNEDILSANLPSLYRTSHNKRNSSFDQSSNERIDKQGRNNTTLNSPSGTSVESAEKSTGNAIVNSAGTEMPKGGIQSSIGSNTAKTIAAEQVTTSSGSIETDDLNSVNSTNEDILSANLPSLYRNRHNKNKSSVGQSSDERIDKPSKTSTAMQDPTHLASKDNQTISTRNTASSTYGYITGINVHSMAQNLPASNVRHRMITTEQPVASSSNRHVYQQQANHVRHHAPTNSFPSYGPGVNRFPAPAVQSASLVQTRRVTMIEETVGHVNQLNSAITTNTPVTHSGSSKAPNPFTYQSFQVHRGANNNQNNLVVPQNSLVMPQNNITVPKNNTIMPQNTITVPKNNLVMLQNNITVPQNNIVVPQNNIIVPQNNTVMPHNNTVMPQNNIVMSQNNIVMSQNNIIVPQNNTVMPQNNIVLPQNNTVMPRNNIVLPQNNTVMPRNNIVMPQNNITVPKNNTIIPQNTITVPKNNLVMLQNNITVPQNNIVVPQNNIIVPQNNTVLPQNNTVMPRNNIVMPQNNTVMPQNNIVMPQNNTVMPQNNTVMPQNNKVMPQINQAVGISGIRNLSVQTVNSASYVGSTYMNMQRYPILFVPGQTVQTRCREDNPVHARYSTQPPRSSQFMKIQQGQERASLPVLGSQVSQYSASVPNQSCSFLPQTAHNRTYGNQTLPSQGNENQQQRPIMLSQGYRHYQSYNNSQVPINSASVLAQQRPAVYHQMQGNFQQRLLPQQHTSQPEAMPLSSVSCQTSYKNFPISQVPQVHKARMLGPQHNLPSASNSNIPQNVQVGVSQGIAISGVNLTSENTMRLPLASKEPEQQNDKKNSEHQDQTPEVINMVNQNSEATVSRIHVTENVNSHINTDKNRSGNNDSCVPEISIQESANKHPQESANKHPQESANKHPQSHAADNLNISVSTDKEKNGNNNCVSELSNQNSANKHLQTHKNKRKQTLTSRENLNEQITLSLEKSTTSSREQERDTATLNQTCPVENISDSTLPQNVDTSVASASSIHLDSVASASGDRVAVQKDQPQKQTVEPENNQNERNQAKKAKNKGSFIRVGTSFLCNMCKMETEDLNYFRKHVWIHVHIKKKCCKECPASSGASGVASCQIVNSVMNGLKYGSAGNVVKRIKKEPDAVMLISDDEEEVEEIVDTNTERETEQNIRELKVEGEEVTPVLIKEEDTPEEEFVNQSQESDSGSIVYEGTVKKVAPLKMQIKLPHPYKVGKKKKKDLNDKQKQVSFGLENDTCNIEETSASNTGPEIDGEHVDKADTGTKQKQGSRKRSASHRKSQEDHTSTESYRSNKPGEDSSDSIQQRKESTTEKRISRDVSETSDANTEVGDNAEGVVETIPTNQRHVENNGTEITTTKTTNGQTTSDDSTKEHSAEIPGYQCNGAVEESSAGNVSHHREDSNFYICGTKGCGYSCMSSKDYLDHLNARHKNEDQLVCIHCGLKSKRPDEHLRHMHGHLKPNNKFSVFVCSICQNQCNVLYKFIHHLKAIHSYERSFTCFFCEETVPSILHMKEHCERNLLKCVQCPHCTVKDTDRQVIVKHIKQSHPGLHKGVTVTGQLICRARENNNYRQQTQNTHRQTVGGVNQEENSNRALLDVVTLSSEDTSGCGNNVELEAAVPVGQTITEPVYPVTDNRQSQDPVTKTEQESRIMNRQNHEPLITVEPVTHDHQESNEPVTGSYDKDQNEQCLGTAAKENTEPQLEYELRKCVNCSYVGKTNSLFQEHILLHQSNHHGSGKQFQCPECPDSRDTLKSLKEHLSCHLGTRQLTILYCEVCEFVSNVMEILASHFMTSHPSCSESVDQNMSIRKIKVTSPLLCCDTCGYLSASEEDFNFHIQAHENEKALMTAVNIRRPFPIPSGDHFSLPVSCCECSYTTKSREQLIIHLEKHPTVFPEFLDEEMTIERHNENSVTRTNAKPMDKANTEQKYSNSQLGDQQRSSDALPATVENSTQNLQRLRDRTLNENTEENRQKEVQNKGCTLGEILDKDKVLRRIPENIHDGKAIFLGSEFLHEKLQNCVVKFALPEESYRCKICRRTMKTKYEVHKHVLKHFNVWMFKCDYCNHKTLESSKLHMHTQIVHPGDPVMYKKISTVELKGRIQKGRRRLISKLATEMTPSQTFRQWVHKDSRLKDIENTDFIDEPREVDLPQERDEIQEVTDGRRKRNETDMQNKSVDNESEDLDADDSSSKQMSLSSSEASTCKGTTSRTEGGKPKMIKAGKHFICSICGLKSSIMQAVAVHMRSHKKNIKCPCCSFVASNMSSLQSHLKTIHNDDFSFVSFKHSSLKKIVDTAVETQKGNSGATDVESSSRMLNVSKGTNEPVSEIQEGKSGEDSDDENPRPMTRTLQKNLLEKYSNNIKSNKQLPKQSSATTSAVDKPNPKLLVPDIAESTRKEDKTTSAECNKFDRGSPLVKEWLTSKVKLFDSNYSCGFCGKEFANKSNVERHILEVCCKKDSTMHDFALFKSKSVKKNGNDRPSTKNRDVSSSPRPNVPSKTAKKQSPSANKNSSSKDATTKKKNTVSKRSTSSVKFKNLRSIIPKTEEQRLWIHSKIKKEGNFFRCGLCRFTSMYRGNLTRHLMHIHDKDFKNANTGKVKSSSSQANAEGNRSSKKQDKVMPSIIIFKCNSCNTSFKSEIKIQEHISRSCTKTLYRCPLCPTYFNTDKRYIKSHSTQKHGRTVVPAVCTESELYRRFSIPWRANILDKKHKSQKSDSLPSVDTTSKPWVLNYSKNNMTQAYCRECRFEALSLHALQIHRNWKHNDKIFSCGMCDKYETPSILQLKIHTETQHRNAMNMKFFICPRKTLINTDSEETSSRQFSDSSAKDSEGDSMEKVCFSTNDSQIFCKECNYKSLNYHRFQQHCYRRHSKSLLLCLYCKAFKGATVVQLELHCIEAHKHQDMKFAFIDSCEDMPAETCILPQCKYAIMNAYRYKEHLYNHLNYRPYSCKYCSYNSVRRDLVQKHIRSSHPLKLGSTNKDAVICDRKDAVEMKVKKLLKKSNIYYLKSFKGGKDLKSAPNSSTVASKTSASKTKLQRYKNKHAKRTGIGVTALMIKKRKILEMNLKPKNFYEKRIVRGEVKYHCIKCPAKYSHVGSIWYHVRYTHILKDLRCPVCKKSQRSRYFLQKHMQQHRRTDHRRRLAITPQKVKHETKSEEEHTDVYSDEGTPKTNSRAEKNGGNTEVQQPRKRKLTKKRSSYKKENSSPSVSDSDEDDDDIKKPRKSPRPSNKRRKDSERSSVIGKSFKKLRPIESSSDSSSSIEVIKKSSKKRRQAVVSDDESVTSDSESEKQGELHPSEDWYRCNMCSYCTNDIRYYSRHLVCHDTFTRFTPGEKVKSTVAHTITTENKPATIFLCSYCSNYEHTLAAMRQHSERCHPCNVFDCTKVATSGLGTTETLVDLQPKVIVMNKCKTMPERSATLSDEKLPQVQQNADYSTEDIRNDVDSDCTDDYIGVKEEGTCTSISPVSKNKKLTCSGIEKVRDLNLKSAELQSKGNNSRPVKTEEKFENKEYSPDSYNKQSGALASIMDAYSGMYDSLSDEDDSMEENSEEKMERMTENRNSDMNNVKPSQDDLPVTVSDKVKSDVTERETVRKESKQNSCVNAFKTSHEDSCPGSSSTNIDSSSESLPDVSQPDKISAGDTSINMEDCSLGKETPTSINESDKCRAVIETNSYVLPDGNNEESKLKTLDSTKYDISDSMEQEVFDARYEDTSPAKVTAGGKECLKDVVEVIESEQTGTVAIATTSQDEETIVCIGCTNTGDVAVNDSVDNTNTRNVTVNDSVEFTDTRNVMVNDSVKSTDTRKISVNDPVECTSGGDIKVNDSIEGTITGDIVMNEFTVESTDTTGNIMVGDSVEVSCTEDVTVNDCMEVTDTGNVTVCDSVEVPSTGDIMMNDFVEVTDTGNVTVNDSVEVPSTGDVMVNDFTDIGNVTVGDSVEVPSTGDVTMNDFIEDTDTGNVMVGNSVEVPSTGDITMNDFIEVTDTGNVTVGDTVEVPSTGDITMNDFIEVTDTGNVGQ